jgi:enoyl-CoA hydratase/carnithine racemase
MLSQVVDPPERLHDEAQTLGEMIARNSPTAVAVSKRALWRALELGLTEACREGALDLAAMWGHPDQTEGPAAFAERRDPVWEPVDRGRLGSDGHGPGGHAPGGSGPSTHEGDT